MQGTPANVHDSQVLGQLLHGQEEEVHGDKAYVGQEATIRQKAPKARNCLLQRASRGHPLSAWQKKWNPLQNAIRAKVEHVFGTFFSIVPGGRLPGKGACLWIGLPMVGLGECAG